MSSIIREGKENRSLTHENEKCVGCGICSDLCPTKAIKLGPILPIARGLLKSDLININPEDCCLCGLCASSCPFDALEFGIDGVNIKDMDNYPKWTHDAQIDDETCIYCGRCEKACPTDAIFLNRSLPDVKELVRGETEIDQEKCIQCGVCEEMCPADAINMARNDINSSNPSIASSVDIDESKCIYCSICKRVCPVDAIKIVCTTCMERDEIADPEINGDIMLDNNQCIKCGWCQEICPVDAAVVSKPFEGEIIFRDDFTCKGESCHACADVCPCNAISIVENKSSINPLFCTLCGACAKACPQEGIVIKRENMNLENIRSKSWQNRLGSLIDSDS
jgi:4Fe-4S ferredoxin